MIPSASPAKRFFKFQLFLGFSLLLPIEHDEGSRLAVSACACARAFARSGASKFKESLKKVPFPECVRSSLFGSVTAPLPSATHHSPGNIMAFSARPLSNQGANIMAPINNTAAPLLCRHFRPFARVRNAGGTPADLRRGVL